MISVRSIAKDSPERTGMDADPDDVVMVAEVGGQLVGFMKVKVIPLVHDMQIDAGLTRLRVADALLHYATGYVKASGFSEALVLVAKDNEVMQGFVGALATKEDESQAYVLGVR